jgi:hypothetical protein
MIDDGNKKPNIDFGWLASVSNNGLKSVVNVANSLGLKSTLLSVAATVESAARSGLAVTLKESTQLLSSQAGRAFTHLAPSAGLFIMANAIDPESAKLALEESLKIIAAPSPFDQNTLASISGFVSSIKTDKEVMFAGIAAITAGGVSAVARVAAEKVKKYIPKISPEYYEKTVNKLAEQILLKVELAPRGMTEIEKVEYAFDSVLEDNSSWVESKFDLSGNIFRGIGGIAAAEHKDEVENTSDLNVSYPHVM